MQYGMISMGVAQTLNIAYGYIFNSLNEFEITAIVFSLISVIIMAFVGIIPGAILHFIQRLLPAIPSIILGSIIFLIINNASYLASGYSSNTVQEIIYSNIVFLISGILLGYLYAKEINKTHETEST